MEAGTASERDGYGVEREVACLTQCTDSQLDRSVRRLGLREDRRWYQNEQEERLRQRSKYGIHNQVQRGSK